MVQVAIRLERGSWTFDESARLGPKGGFGEVFTGNGADGQVAIKRLNLTAGAAAHREMSIGSNLAGRNLSYVVPVLDYGLDAESDRYFLVMPVCEQSLQAVVDAGPASFDEARQVLIDILRGLIEAEDVVHRDLKPGNVLRLGDRWRLADFGIAKFVEDSTSLQTLRHSLTPAYGAPEQWNGERPSHATDVYALGCVCHALLRGRPPFTGDADNVREAHLHSVPPSLDEAPPRATALITQMLRKSPEARPSLARCLDVLSGISAQSRTSTPSSRLADAARVVAQEVATADAAKRAEEARQRAHDSLVKDASHELRAMRERLFQTIEAESENVSRTDDHVSLGKGVLKFLDPTPLPLGAPDAADNRHSSWDVKAFSRISATRISAREQGGYASVRRPGGMISVTSYDKYEFSASLVYGRPSQTDEYRWREISFFSWTRSNGDDVPFALPPQEREFDLALARVVSGLNVAFGPEAIDGEDEEGFQGRWVSLFAKAALGTLHRPNSLPLSSSYFD